VECTPRGRGRGAPSTAEGTSELSARPLDGLALRNIGSGAAAAADVGAVLAMSQQFLAEQHKVVVETPTSPRRLARPRVRRLLPAGGEQTFSHPPASVLVIQHGKHEPNR
jgi:hypothetical protein